jgi:natural product precursor
MKNLNAFKKLNLAKETVAKLSSLDLNLVKGGGVTVACDTNDTCRYKPTSPVICTK